MWSILIKLYILHVELKDRSTSNFFTLNQKTCKALYNTYANSIFLEFHHVLIRIKLLFFTRQKAPVYI